ncbi:MAG: polyprenyl synthetase family protein [Xanthomonadales bacterium]|nr:polyprenyl synthetase family protein [Xanthomonadales bacterium]
MSVSGPQLQHAPEMVGLEQIRSLVADDLAAVDEYIRQSLDSDVVLIRQIADYIIGGGGKRLRPIMHLLAARALGYRGEHHIRLAATIEFIHTATLLHDDVVDESSLRRGRQTANAVWGNAASVLVGDFLYSRAFQMMVEVDSMRVMDVLAETTNRIAEGEVKQLLHLNNPETDEASYLDVIACKTAKLFEAAGRLAAILSRSEDAAEQALGSFGANLGMAFQLADDALDYGGSVEVMGKNVGDDLAEGKPTLPLIRVLEAGNEAQRALVRSVLEDGSLDRLPEVVDAINACGALDYTHERAVAYCDTALDQLSRLPKSDYREALRVLAQFSCQRLS